MTSAGQNFDFCRTARPHSDFGPLKVVKPEPFTDMEIAQLDALIKKNLNELNGYPPNFCSRPTESRL